ncbi:hypothetical protein [Robertkochia solimangrovi]|uniref:hypothetical protein n=1 Tax=Robertkochia solimangrovi TaxID=2213046 RepID=UPI00118027FC|nr:hypothetical protein [Robertkochia solimangrovi]TRZ45275.1 hypothetical protein DMZ48_05890 [Robertkochia solimangrovi]
MNKILVPTDFTVKSLSLLRETIARQTEKVNIVLVYGTNLSDCTVDMLFYTRTEQIDKLLEPNFLESLNILKNKHASVINGVCMDIYHGYSGNAFENYITAHGITDAYIPLDKSSRAKNSRLISSIKKSKLPVCEVALPMEVVYQTSGSFAKLMTSKTN